MTDKLKCEIGLSLVILGFSSVGILFMLWKPTVGFISSVDTTVFGVLMLITGVMYVPGLLYKIFVEK